MATSQGLDSPYCHDIASHATAIKAAGYGFCASYYFEQSAYKQRLDFQTALTLSKSGLFNVALYENGYPTTAAYFTSAQGHTDGAHAVRQAIAAHQPSGTPVYACCDFDAAEGDLAGIEAYFKAFQSEVKPSGILCGAYASGRVLSAVTEAGYCSFTYLSGSRAWNGYSLWAHRANIVQTVLETKVLGTSCDLAVSDGNGGGFKVSPC